MLLKQLISLALLFSDFDDRDEKMKDEGDEKDIRWIPAGTISVVMVDIYFSTQ